MERRMYRSTGRGRYATPYRQTQPVCDDIVGKYDPIKIVGVTKTEEAIAKMISNRNDFQ